MSEVVVTEVDESSKEQLETALHIAQEHTAGIVHRFDEVIAGIRERLQEANDVAKQATSVFMTDVEQLQQETEQSTAVFDEILARVNEIFDGMPDLSALEVELVRINDVLATLEATVKSSLK